MRKLAKLGARRRRELRDENDSSGSAGVRFDTSDSSQNNRPKAARANPTRIGNSVVRSLQLILFAICGYFIQNLLFAPLEMESSSPVLAHLGAICAAILLMVILTSGQALELFLTSAILLLFTSFVSSSVARYAMSLNLGLPRIHSAISASAYSGHQQLNDYLALFLSLMSALAAGVFVSVCSTLFVRRRPADDARADEEPAPRKRGANFPALIVFLLFAVTSLPDFLISSTQSLHDPLALGELATQKKYTWSFLSQYGFRPYRDYWFPLAGDYNQLGSDPYSLWSRYLVCVILFGALFFGVYRLFERRLLAAIAVLLPAGALITAGEITDAEHAAAGLGAILIFGALWNIRPRAMDSFIWYGIYLAWAAYRDPLILAYSVPAILLIGLNFFFEKQSEHTHRRRTVQIFSLVSAFVLCIAFELAIALARGQLAGLFDHYLTLPALLSASNVPMPLLSWYELTSDPLNVLLLGVHLLAGLAICFFLEPRERRFGVLLLGLTFFASILMFKLLVRPLPVDEVLLTLVLSGCLIVAYLSVSFNALQTAALAALLGIFLGHYHSSIREDIEGRETRTAELPANMAALTEIATRISTPRESLDTYYSPARIGGLDAESMAVVTYAQSKNFTRFSRKVFVFGNEAFLYPLLKEQPCKFIALEDMTALPAQSQMLECLQKNRPELIIYSGSLNTYGVPDTVRLPLLYEFVQDNYILDKSFGRYQILRPRTADEKLDVQFWLTQLGSELRLAALPYLVRSREFPVCDAAQNEGCHTFARVEADTSKIQDSLEFSAGGNTFTLTFTNALRKKHALIDLDHVWFWRAAVASGLTPLINNPTARAVEVSKRRVPPDVIY